MIKKYISRGLLLTLFPLAFSCSSIPTATEVHSENEEWVSLFNGEDIDDWIVKIHHHETGENFGNTFRVEDGILKVRYDGYEDFNERFGHLYYKEPFSSYHLVVEFRFIEGWREDAPSYTIRNSGIMFHSQDPHTMPREQDWPISVEFQMLAGLDDGKARPTGNMCSPGTDIVYEGEIYPDHCLNSSSDTYGLNEWVRAELIVYGDSLITHVINGDTVLQYSKPQIGGGVVNNYNPAIKEDGKPLKEGFIALQSEGQPIDFRKVEILKIEK